MEERDRVIERKKVLVLIALAVSAALTGVSFAAVSGTTSVAPTLAGVGDGGFAETKAATTADSTGGGKYNRTPTWAPTIGAAGQIPADLDGDGSATSTADNRPGDLYVIDTGTYMGDILVTLYLTNPADLAAGYAYLNLAITVYETTDANRTAFGGEPVVGKANGAYDTFLTLTNGYVSFKLDRTGENGGKYSVGVDAGSFYPIGSSSTNLQPKFFLEVRPA